MRLLAISDLHIGIEQNFRALAKITPRPDDWLMLGGDMAETIEQTRAGLEILAPRFGKLFWIPGNHDLWTLPDGDGLRGEAKYRELIKLCREFGVLTPEDPFVDCESATASYCIAPVFLLYDYSFRPPDVSREGALRWAMEQDLLCADEHYLHPDPHPSRDAWCHERLEYTLRRLREIPAGRRIILLNHFPLRYDLVRLPMIPRFSLWCGTNRTENWHREFNIEAVVYGHLHYPSTLSRDGVRFEEVSLGYPRQWDQDAGIDGYLRVILSELRSAK